VIPPELLDWETIGPFAVGGGLLLACALAEWGPRPVREALLGLLAPGRLEDDDEATP
jgi:hypothetical protein